MSPDPMVPRPYRVIRRRQDTADTTTLWFEPLDGAALPFRAGQFAMLGAPAGGEVPISISGDPTKPEPLEHTVRDVGGVTRGICAMRPGDTTTVRGAYGTGWEVADGIGGDVLFVAGGIGLAPLRPAILEVLAQREAYRRVMLLYGTRTPDDVLFEPELESWRGRLDFDVDVTVDAAPPAWRGRVGLVTTLLDRAGFDPASTLALACGPEIMMRVVADAVAKRGVPAGRIRISMERNMHCGIGLCGHRQLREYFICIDGPVFSYRQIAPIMTAREL